MLILSEQLTSEFKGFCSLPPKLWRLEDLVMSMEMWTQLSRPF